MSPGVRPASSRAASDARSARSYTDVPEFRVKSVIAIPVIADWSRIFTSHRAQCTAEISLDDGRLRKRLRRARFGQHASNVHDRQAFGDPADEIDVVLDHDHCEARRAKLIDDLLQP